MTSRMIFRFFALSIALLSAIVLSCSKPATLSKVPVVAVSISPQKYFVEQIADSLVRVLVMVPPGVSEHTYEPKPRQMEEFRNARLYFGVGIEFERAWLPRLAGNFPSLRIVHTDSGIQKLSIESRTVIGSSGEEHDHEGLDPHIWLSPELVKKQAASITEALCASFPEHAAVFRHRDSLFLLGIDSLQARIRSRLPHNPGELPIMVFHPAWGYFTHEFGLRQVPIEVEGHEPSARDLGIILDFARANRVKTIFVQPQFSRRTAEILAADLHARVATADPLAENWPANLLAFSNEIAQP